jgi:hypothetical protein
MKSAVISFGLVRMPVQSNGVMVVYYTSAEWRISGRIFFKFLIR